MYFSARYFTAQFFTADYFGQAGVAPPVVEVPDPYAWFPSDPFTPDRGKRYEEYAKEKRVRTKGPQRVPRAKRIPPTPIIPPVPPLTIPPVVQPQPQPEILPPAAVVEPVVAEAESFGADWTSYAHIPVDSQEECDEMLLLLTVLS